MDSAHFEAVQLYRKLAVQLDDADLVHRLNVVYICCWYFFFQ